MKASIEPKGVSSTGSSVSAGGVVRRLQLSLGVLGLVACSPQPRPYPEVPSSALTSRTATATEESTQTTGEWSYSGASGPASWAKLRPEWAGCAEETGQSPVDLSLDALAQGSTEKTANSAQQAKASTPTPAAGTAADTADEALGPAPPYQGSKIESRMGVLPLHASSDGRFVQLGGSSTQLVELDGKAASLDRIELHLPSEHSLSGLEFDLEMVLWFRPTGSPEVALSLLFRRGQAHPALGALVDHLPERGTYANTSLGSQLSLTSLLPDGELKLLSYWGSLSIPPCTTPVARLVLAYVSEISAEQLEKLRKSLPPSSRRPTSPLGKRSVGVVPLTRTVPLPSPTQSTP